MSRAKELAKSIGSTLASQGAMTVVSILFFAYFGRALAKSEMAVFAFMATLVSWVELVSGLGLATMTMREVPALVAEDRHDQAHRLVSSTLTYSMSVAVVAAVALFALAPYLSGAVFGSPAYTTEFRILSVVALAQSLCMKLSLMQWALQRFPVIALCGAVSTLSCRALALCGYFVFGLRGFLVGFGLGLVPVMAIHGWSLRRVLTPRILPLWGLLRRSYGYIGTDVLRNLFQNLDRPVVGFFLGDVALADYFVAKRVYDFLNTAALNVAAPVGAKLSELKNQGKAALSAYFYKAMYLMAILFIPAGFAITGMGQEVLRLVVGAKYSTGGLIMACFGVAIMLEGVSQVWRESVYRLLAPRFLLMYTLLLAGSTFALYALLLPLMGPSGIPVSYAAAFFVTSLFAAYLLRGVVNVAGRWDIYIRPLVCGLLVLGVIYSASWLGDSVWAMAARAAAAMAVYALSFLFLAPPEARELLGRIWRRVSTCRAAPAPDAEAGSLVAAESEHTS